MLDGLTRMAVARFDDAKSTERSNYFLRLLSVFGGTLLS